MLVFLAGLVIFFGVHSVRMIAPGFRDARIVAREGAWKGIYSLLSLAGVALIVWGWMQYRADAPDIYIPPDWGRHLAALLILPGFILNFANNNTVGHIKAFVRHPMLTGVGVWSLGHLFANGDLASILLFGSFLVYAIADRIAVERRGEPAPVFQSVRGDVFAVVVGLAAYLLFALWLHGFLFGVSPF